NLRPVLEASLSMLPTIFPVGMSRRAQHRGLYFPRSDSPATHYGREPPGQCSNVSPGVESVQGLVPLPLQSNENCLPIPSRASDSTPISNPQSVDRESAVVPTPPHRPRSAVPDRASIRPDDSLDSIPCSDSQSRYHQSGSQSGPHV